MVTMRKTWWEKAPDTVKCYEAGGWEGRGGTERVMLLLLFVA